MGERKKNGGLSPTLVLPVSILSLAMAGPTFFLLQYAISVGLFIFYAYLAWRVLVALEGIRDELRLLREKNQGGAR